MDVANVLGRLLADGRVNVEVGLMAVLDVLESRVLLPVEVAPDIDGETIDRSQLPRKNSMSINSLDEPESPVADTVGFSGLIG